MLTNNFGCGLVRCETPSTWLDSWDTGPQNISFSSTERWATSNRAQSQWFNQLCLCNKTSSQLCILQIARIFLAIQQMFQEYFTLKTWEVCDWGSPILFLMHFFTWPILICILCRKTVIVSTAFLFCVLVYDWTWQGSEHPWICSHLISSTVTWEPHVCGWYQR